MEKRYLTTARNTTYSQGSQGLEEAHHALISLSSTHLQSIKREQKHTGFNN
jgi:hypothetical protein